MAHQLSGCQVCATTSQCNAAFHNGPGQYCGSYYDISISGNESSCAVRCSPRAKSHRRSACATSSIDNWREPLLRITILHTATAWIIHLAMNTIRRLHSHRWFVSYFAFAAVDSAGDVEMRLLCWSSNTLHLGIHPLPLPFQQQHEYHHAPHYGSNMDGKPSSGGTCTNIASGLGGLAVGTILGTLIGRNNA